MLACCLRGEPSPPALVAGLAASGDPSLFSVLAEGLSDRFEKRLADAYVSIFSDVIAPFLQGWSAGALRERYERVRGLRPCGIPDCAIERVVVLSRVTLGADVAVTSVLLDAAKRRFPGARILFAAGRKNYDLFAADARLEHLPVAYGRSGSVADRLAVLPALRHECSRPGTIVIDSDSRLTQLGLVPVCPEERYFLFESRVYGGQDEDPLPVLARRWASETFGAKDARPYIAPAEAADAAPGITVSLGVGGNPAKRIADPFERELLRMLARTGASILVDSGGGGEEAERVRRAVTDAGAAEGQVRIWEGSFAAFAGAIAKGRLYAGYDSAGQHVAAACGVPLLTVFAGFPSPRMFSRWFPTGPGPREVIRVDQCDPDVVLAQAERAVGSLL